MAAGGQADNPNGSRFAYLSTLTAVAAAAGILWLLGRVPPRSRRAAALAAIGAIAVEGAVSARAALRFWPERSETFRGFHGQDTLIGRAAARWDRYGSVEIARGLGHSSLAIEAVRRFRLDPGADGAAAPRGPVSLRARIVSPGTEAGSGERPVERIVDPWGKSWAVIFARR